MIAIASQNLMNIQKGRIGLDWYQDGDELWCEFGRCASARPGPGFQLTATAGQLRRVGCRTTSPSPRLRGEVYRTFASIQFKAIML
jgi:hypothetical protein